jgi:hypothetical protein
MGIDRRPEIHPRPVKHIERFDLVASDGSDGFRQHCLGLISSALREYRAVSIRAVADTAANINVRRNMFSSRS